MSEMVRLPSTRPVPRESYTLVELLALTREDALHRQRQRDAGEPAGPTTGIRGLDDEILGGCLEPGLYTLNGVPGMGKTSLALQIANDCGFPAVFLSCEMAPLELMRRLVARVSHRSMRDLKTMHASQVDRALIDAEERINPHLHILDGTLTRWSADKLHSAVLVRLGESPHGLLVVDSLHAWALSAAGDGATEYDALNGAVGSLRSLAQGYNIPVVQIAERNRASMSAGGLHSSAGSRRIEYASDVYLDLSKPEDQPAGAQGFTVPKRVILTAEKNRFGPMGASVSLLFDGPHQRFQEEG